MIVLLDTSQPTCTLALYSNGAYLHEESWEVGRELAEKLLEHLEGRLKEHGATGLHDVTAIAVFRGPGSFTGLRIGMSVLNTLADTLHVPIVGATGESWREEALKRLNNGDNDQIVLPLYGREANITTPRK